MKKLDLSKLPEDVQAALQPVRELLQKRFAGRRSVPEPIVGEILLEEEGPAPDGIEPPEDEGVAPEQAAPRVHFLLAAPSLAIKETMLAAALSMPPKGTAGAAQLAALFKVQDTAIVCCCHYVEGMPRPEPGQDPRVVAREYLKSLREEPGALGEAWSTVAGAALELIQSPGAKLGKV